MFRRLVELSNRLDVRSEGQSEVRGAAEALVGLTT